MSIDREWSKERNMRLYCAICDNCDKPLEICDSFEEVIESMNSSGWKSTLMDDGGWVNICDECSAK